MSEEGSNVTFVGGHAVEQQESLDSNLGQTERDAAKEAVRKAIQEAGESSAKDAKSGKAKDPFKPAGASRASEKASEGKESSDTSRSGERARGPDGKFIPTSTDVAYDHKPAGGKTQKEESGAEEGEDEHGDDEVVDTASASVKQILRQREKLAAIKKESSEVKSALGKEREDFQRQQAEFQQQQVAFQRQQAEMQRQWQAMQNLRKDPAQAMRQLGYDPEQFILDLATDGTPEGQARRREQERDNQLKQIIDWQQQQMRAQQDYQRQAQEHAVVQHRQNSVNQFLGLALNEEKYPLITNFYKGDEAALVARGDLAAHAFRELTGGREAGFEDLLDYIEDQLAEKTNAWYSSKGGKVEVKPVPHGDRPSGSKSEQSKPKSKGKNLTPDASGERGSMRSKELKDLDAEERLEAAKQAVKVALANAKED